MSEGVRKIITVLIVMVICVVVGALVINVVAPNALSLVLNGIDRAVYNATGLNVNINGDEISGSDTGQAITDQTAREKFSNDAGGMAGFNQGWGGSGSSGGSGGNP